jgi:tetratricopeptide (TPR) repeat protein
MNIDEKSCPFCGETIKAVAVTCKHCNSNLNSRSGPINREEREVRSGIHAGSVTFGIILIICLALVATNPNKSKFTEFITQRIVQQMDKSEDLNSDVAKKFVAGVAGVFLDAAVRDENYFIFSKYTLDLHLLRLFNQDVEDITFIGVAGHFFPLNKSVLSEEIKEESKLENQQTKEEVIPDSSQLTQKSNDQIFKYPVLNSMLNAASNLDIDQFTSNYGKIKLSPKPDTGDRIESRRLNTIGLSQVRSENFVDAEKTFQDAYQINPADPEVINNLGYMQFKNRKFNQSFDSLEKTILIAPDRSSAWFNLFELLSYQNNTDSSVCGALLIGLKFTSNRDVSIDLVNQRISQEDNPTIKKKMSDAMYCAENKKL